MMKYYTLLTIILLNCFVATAQQSANDIKVRSFDEASWQKATKDVDYHKKAEKRNIYQHETKKKGYEDDFVRPKKEKTNSTKNRTPTTESNNWDWSGTKPFGILLLVGILGAMIAFFIKNNTWVSDESIQDFDAILANVEENLPEADVETPLQSAIKVGNYKVATRLYYLLLIKTLAEKNYIKWSKDKTNRQYVNEVKGVHFVEHFRQATAIYERAWFGNDAITSTDFENYTPIFDDLLKKI